MFIALSNTPLPYAWGQKEGIARFIGEVPGVGPEAELWFGTHAASPTKAGRTFPDGCETHPTLAAWVAAHPERMLGDAAAAELPILVKVLAAKSPLSLQVHPNARQAREGFAEEQARGVALDDPARNFADANPKPEMIVAVSDTFDALCGFRPADEVERFVSDVRALADETERVAVRPLATILGDPRDVAGAVGWLLSDEPGVDHAVHALARIAARAAGSAADPQTFATVAELARDYPGDPGIVIAALMNRIRLQRGQCLFAPAGVLHAYLHGVGIELMTASDNVIRGGLTAKHIDPAQLMRLLSFHQAPAVLSEGLHPQPGVTAYQPPAPFTLTVVDVDVAGDLDPLPVAGPSILIAEAGPVVVRSRESRAEMAQGDALFVAAHEGALAFAGRGRVWVATAHHLNEK